METQNPKVRTNDKYVLTNDQTKFSTISKSDEHVTAWETAQIIFDVEYTHIDTWRDENMPGFRC